MQSNYSRTTTAVAYALFGLLACPAEAAELPKRETQRRPASARLASEITFPPALPGGKDVVTDTSNDFLKPKLSGQSVVCVGR
jgi:hypothetical protein